MTGTTATDRDHRSFGAFFVENRPAALRQAARLVGDHAAAEDLVAEAFAKLWARWSADTIDAPARYLSRIIRNAATDEFRRQARERDALARASGADMDRESVAAVVEARLIVAGLLDHVSPMQRRALSLRYLRDLSEAQTAQSLGVSQGTAKSSAWRGLRRMRTRYELESAA